MPQTLQHRRRIGTAGAPPTLLTGQFGINDLGGASLPSLYVGTPAVKTLVSNTRQVELDGEQTIIGDKTIAVARLHVLGGNSGNVLSTDGLGNLAWIVPAIGPTAGDEWGVGIWGTAMWSGAAAGGIPEPPIGLLDWVRRGDGTWQNASLLYAPISNVSFPEAPNDGQLYSRNGLAGAWVVSPGGAGGGITEAPLLGGPFVRQLGAWTDMFPIDSGTY
jgi:hypothetical protein